MITIYKPTIDDLWFKQSMMSDELTMSYNHAFGGTISFPKSKWESWYQKWLTDDNKYYYRYLVNEKAEFIGEIAYHYDDESCVYLTDVLIHAKYRNKGYGGIALDLLCGIAKENGISVLYDELWNDNPAINLFLKHGFIIDKETEKTVILKKEL